MDHMGQLYIIPDTIVTIQMEELRNTQTDEEIALLIQQGSEEAFSVVMDRYSQKLLRYGRKFLSNPENIEDIVQDVFIKVYQNIKSFDGDKKFSPWIYRIAHNCFVNHIRDTAKEPLLFFDFDSIESFFNIYSFNFSRE